jgi:hypothetical protein
MSDCIELRLPQGGGGRAGEGRESIRDGGGEEGLGEVGAA